MTDQSVMLINDWLASIIVSSISSSLNMNVILAVLIVNTAGGILQTGGASSYVTSHIQDSQKLVWQYQDRGKGTLTVRLAKALAIAALVLFLVSGVDVATKAAGGGDLLPLNSMMRGMIFGFGAVALATTAFFVSINKGSILVSILLIVTGTLMAIAGVVSTRGLTLITFPGPIIFLFLGFWIIALGIVKSIITTRRNARTIFSK
jgi:hypothetical protein